MNELVQNLYNPKRPRKPVIGSHPQQLPTDHSLLNQNDDLNQVTRVVTGPPTKEHWKLDKDVDECNNCQIKFNFLNRKHHCRKCGNIFCIRCCNDFVRMDQTSNFNQGGILSRCCENCFNLFKSKLIPLKKEYEEEEDLDDNSTLPENNAGLEPTPIQVVPNNSRIPELQNQSLQTKNTLPSDWHWSTF
ncbi:hypothetical protein HK099_007651 [Clydaea vesicula]|uniref:FYVE-type domain-containing protein n=1 Tax=Clydaea vesicula TaxID=447962 RepID=A0AAD5U6N7_9FUNG|nr:hypothetical protein HK099_007651 [Clydaea vesicula]KAJ3394781.1 hypothetical protein HDU92_006570 [Lobulomyces angularis]